MGAGAGGGGQGGKEVWVGQRRPGPGAAVLTWPRAGGRPPGGLQRSVAGGGPAPLHAAALPAPLRALRFAPLRSAGAGGGSRAPRPLPAAAPRTAPPPLPPDSPPRVPPYSIPPGYCPGARPAQLPHFSPASPAILPQNRNNKSTKKKSGPAGHRG